MDEEVAALREQRTRWINAINQGSAAEFVAVLTEDAVWLPARHHAIQGKQKIRAWLDQPFAEFEYDYTVSEVRLRVAGAWAVEQARFSTRASTKAGEVMPLHEGLYTLLWRKISSEVWLIERYIDYSAVFVEVGSIPVNLKV